jgi:hypothetical protein
VLFRLKWHPMLKALSAGVIVAVMVVAVAQVARGGHEASVYPSYYPHEIMIETMPPDRAASLLRENKIAAYVGGGQPFSDRLPSAIRTVESLGDLVVVRINPVSPLAKEKGRACAATEIVIGDMIGRSGFTFHPYPVTPFHGDYLYHVDRAEMAKARIRSGTAVKPPAGPTVRAEGALASLVRAEWRTNAADWDVAIEAVDAAGLIASAQTSLNGWLGPPWLRTGWYQAALLLTDASDTAEPRQRADGLLTRLETDDYSDPNERINLEREFVAALTGGCRKVVAGYRVKREYFSSDFTDGVENIGFDAISGLNSPMFIRTVKLKNFPWNGWLSLAIDSEPNAAWNPIAGFNDAFGRLMWAALSDPALLPAPYDSGWMLNRLSDVQMGPGR